jgi:hypothetical protein
MMKKYLSFNNNASSSDLAQSKYQDELSNSSCSSQTLHISRSIVEMNYIKKIIKKIY